MTGIVLAGPYRTPTTFEAGRFHAPVAGGGPTPPPLSFGRHSSWPGVDRDGTDDASFVWWDTRAVGPDETGRVGHRPYEYADRGHRFLPGHWPTRSIPLFERASSVSVFTQLPARDRAPTDPPPGDG